MPLKVSWEVEYLGGLGKKHWRKSLRFPCHSRSPFKLQRSKKSQRNLTRVVEVELETKYRYIVRALENEKKKKKKGCPGRASQKMVTLKSSYSRCFVSYLTKLPRSTTYHLKLFKHWTNRPAGILEVKIVLYHCFFSTVYRRLKGMF